jgi:hypothetical protein
MPCMHGDDPRAYCEDMAFERGAPADRLCDGLEPLLLATVEQQADFRPWLRCRR